MQVGAATDQGKVRSINQDYYFCSDGITSPNLYIIADGMGGHKGGEVASRIAVNAVKDYILGYYSDDKYISDRLLLVNDALSEANQYVFSISESKEELKGMGTTLTMALLEDHILYTGHIGDSRIYMLRDGTLKKITEDHSLVEQMVRSGSITPEEASCHPQKNIITKALGTQPDVEADTEHRLLENDDLLVICTDGLSNMLKDAEIENTCVEIDDPQMLCDALVEKANHKGGKDNITVIAVKVRWKD